MENKNIRVLVARSQQAVESGQCDDVRECYSIKEAKSFAKYSLTDAYQQRGEFTEPMRYAKVMCGDECEADYFRPEPKAPTATKRVRELLVDLCQAHDEYDKIISRLAARGKNRLDDDQAGQAGIEKKRQQEKILVVAWHISLAARGRSPDTI